MKTRQEATDWALSQKGKLLPWGEYSQCVAFVRNLVNFLGYKQPPSVQSAKELWDANWGTDFTKRSTPEPGDISILNPTSKNPAGHTDVVVQVVPGMVITMDQNLTNPKLGGKAGSPVDKIAWNFPNTRFIGFIRPKFKEEDMFDFNSGDARNLYFAMYGKEPTDKEKADFVAWAKNNKQQLVYETVIRRFNDLNKTVSSLQKAFDPKRVELANQAESFIKNNKDKV